MKPLSSRTVDEIYEVYEMFDIPVPGEDDERVTRKELLLGLSAAGITNKSLRSFEQKETEEEQSDEEVSETETESGDVVVCMTRRNPYFVWRKYQFGKGRRFMPMTKDEALELIQTFDGFHIASREEIRRSFK